MPTCLDKKTGDEYKQKKIFKGGMCEFFRIQQILGDQSSTYLAMNARQ